MGTRARAVDIGDERARYAISRLVGDLKAARRAAGLAQTDVARALGLSRSQYGRLERGSSPNLTIHTASRMCAVLGLDLAVRAYPAGDPIRDAAQIALLERLRSRCHPSLAWSTEVPFAINCDRRAWDAVVSGPTWRCGIEAETALTDVQAVDRRLALKDRDGGADHIVLLLLDTRRNRTALRAAGDILRRRFPGDPEAALKALVKGEDPGASFLTLM